MFIPKGLFVELPITMMNHYLVSLCEHADTSPSTHGARVASNVGATFPVSAMMFVGGASGEYHFGALENAMNEIKNISDNVRDLDDYVVNKIENKERVWGFGHRFHRTDKHPDLENKVYESLGEKKDPRVKVLLELADELGWEGKYLSTVREVGSLLYDKKQIPINVDGVAAGLLLDMNFPSEVALLFPIIGRLPMIARLHVEERNASTNRFVGLVDRNDPHYGERAVIDDLVLFFRYVSRPLSVE